MAAQTVRLLLQKAIPKALLASLQEIGREASFRRLRSHVVGGFVRDLLLGKPSWDIDAVVEGPAATLAKLLAKRWKATLVSHPQFLTFSARLNDGHHVDIATARTETYPEPAALPLVEPATLQDDLYRRDFSINAIALSLDPESFGQVLDPFEGRDDLSRKRIRALHEASFRDDPTRIFRAARFVGRFGFTLELRTQQWLNDAISQQVPARLTGARLREELVPLVLERTAPLAFQCLEEWGALTFLVPGLHWDKTHEFFFRQLLQKSPKGDGLTLRLMTLLHNMPYPRACGSLRHLQFSKSLTRTVEQALLLLVRLRQGTLTSQSSTFKGLRIEASEFLHLALTQKSLFPKRDAAATTTLWKRFEESEPALKGKDILGLGYRPGPSFSRMLEALRQARWEGKLRTREEEIRFLIDNFPRP